MGIKNLVIVESPAKAKTIAKYLNASKALRHMGKFSVMASMGHIRDLKNRELSIDINNDFATHYEVLKDKVKLVNELKEKVAMVENVYLAADYDREGEAISEHIKETLGLKKYHRITFTEITPRALEKAILSPRKIDQQLVDAQETRRVLDRLVGFKISPLLWKRYNANKIHLSAGRVQSAVLHIIKEKEDEVNSFESSRYWYFHGTFDLRIGAETHKLEEVKLYDNDRVFKIDEDIKQVRTYVSKIRNEFSINDLKIRQLKQSADLPFITSTLQQEAYSKLGFPLKRTMHLAQDLYEKGYITYMRTDSFNISADFKVDVEKYIADKYGLDYFEGTNQRKSKVSKSAQEAHEAIRPTHVETVVIDELGFTTDHKKLYDMIWKRTLAYFMKAAIFDELEIRIYDAGLPKTAYFISSFKKVKFNGFQILHGIQNETYDFETYVNTIKKRQYQVKCLNVVARNTWSNPPARYNEATIIKTLEAESIGRPSTFTTILTKLFEKHYVLKSDIRGVDKPVVHLTYKPQGAITEQADTVTIGHERSKLVPSDVGIEIDKFMVDNFDYVIDRKFTATMEEDLDKIAEGNVSKSDVLTVFWKTFGQDVERIESQKKMEKVKVENQHLTYKIGSIEYIVRLAKYGPVIQFQQGEHTKYIDIKSYLKYTNMSYTNVTEEDIKFLTSLPRKIAHVKDKDLLLVAGPYGLYFKHGDENVKIPLKVIKKLLNPDELVTPAELESVVNYHQSKSDAKTEKKQTSKKVKATTPTDKGKSKPTSTYKKVTGASAATTTTRTGRSSSKKP